MMQQEILKFIIITQLTETEWGWVSPDWEQILSSGARRAGWSGWAPYWVRQISSPVEMRTSFLMTVRREREGLWGLRVREKWDKCWLLLTASESACQHWRPGSSDQSNLCIEYRDNQPSNSSAVRMVQLSAKLWVQVLYKHQDQDRERQSRARLWLSDSPPRVLSLPYPYI